MSEGYRTVVEGDVTVLVKKPNRKDLNESQIAYNKAWRKSLEEKAILRQKLNDYLTEQGVWSDDKQKQYEDFVKKINDRELVLKKGGIPLKKAKSIALELKRLRASFRELISERTSYDNNTAEGTADNARFDYLVSVCVIDPSNKQPVFKNIDDYNERGAEPWALKAAGELANFLYDLDPNYESNLPENDFLKKFKFTDDKGRLVNKDGHLISIDEDGVERLIDEKGFYVAYNEDGTKYFINRSGEKVERDEDIVQQPFLDDDGNALDTSEVVAEVEEKPPESSDEVKKTKKKKSDSTE
jgi:hypothetical protein